MGHFFFTRNHCLWFGKGIGYVDAFLLATAMLIENAKLWTLDKRLRVIAEQLGVAADEPDELVQ